MSMKKKKTMYEVCIFLFVIIALTLNHYSLFEEQCIREGNAQPKPGRTMTYCVDHGNVFKMTPKDMVSTRIPGDVIILLVGAGLFYFSRKK